MVIYGKSDCGPCPSVIVRGWGRDGDAAKRPNADTINVRRVRTTEELCRVAAQNHTDSEVHHLCMGQHCRVRRSSD
ncbi:hypothetical protein LSAT2_014602 [Lamellibrachia satsuma]|nr:hypothetical protein LSAT2_014602 [Lamellibrachia satsuma]